MKTTELKKLQLIESKAKKSKTSKENNNRVKRMGTKSGTKKPVSKSRQSRNQPRRIRNKRKLPKVTNSGNRNSIEAPKVTQIEIIEAEDVRILKKKKYNEVELKL